ncbi:MAG: hypothetical protein R3D00_17030 [Bacteroidia bacterium]
MDIFSIYQSALKRKISPDSVGYLDEIIREYPYFTFPRLLKAVVKPENENIFAASAYSVNRKQLKNLLEGKVFFSETPASMDIDTPVTIFPDIAVHGPVHDLFSIVDFESVYRRMPCFDCAFSISEGVAGADHNTFLDWDIKVRTLKNRRLAEQIREELKPTQIPDSNLDQTSPESKKAVSNNLIDAFLKNQSSIRRKNNAGAINHTPVKAAVDSIREDENLVTETMARLNLLQNNRAEAIRIYEKLCLLYPEKSAYFADRINKIKDE